MPFVTTKDQTEIFYKDWGQGQPVVFHHGWPLSSDDWDAQMLFFLQHGYRVVAHDRRLKARTGLRTTGIAALAYSRQAGSLRPTYQHAARRGARWPTCRVPGLKTVFCGRWRGLRDRDHSSVYTQVADVC
ncbi:hypothetical protein DR64_5445 [Paraburkholderia xenovorans LB400]|nr:hypothetical protein DR64_5445 [Paraburkholderia xenovorans LB400]